MTVRARRFKNRQAVEKARQQFRQITGTFRPRKDELGTFVFVAKPSAAEVRGKKRKPRYVRVPAGSARKAYALYVTKSGTVRPVKEKPKNLEKMAERLVAADRPELEPGTPEWSREVKLREELARMKSRLPAYQKPRNLDLFTAGSKRAAEKFYRGRRQPVYAPGQLKKFRAKGRAAVDFEKVAQTAGDAVWRVWQRSRGRDLDLLVEWRAVVVGKDGREHRVEGMARFQARFNQEFTRKQFWRYAFLVLYAELAQQLSQRDLVTSGSAGYVQRLPENRGVRDRREWVNAKGERWEKNEFAEVRLVSWDFDVTETLADR